MPDAPGQDETRSAAAPRTFTSRIADFLLASRVWLLLACIVLTALAWRPSSQLAFDRSIESLFNKDDPRFVYYMEDKRLFGSLETSAVAYEDPDLLTAEGLERLSGFADELRAVEGVQSVLSLADVPRPGAPLDRRPLVEQVAAGEITPDELREDLLSTDLYRNRLLSADGTTNVMLVDLDPIGKDLSVRPAAIQEIRRLGAAHNPPAVLAGGPILVDDVFRHLEEDGQTLGIASSLILTLVIAILFRNLRWLLLPLLVVHVTLIWTKALLVVSGFQMSMVSSPLVALVTVIGVATVVHLTIRFREERASRPPREALRATFVELLPAIFWTSLTTSAGFGSLLASSVAPVQSFGTMMAVGSALVFVAAAALTPGVVTLGSFRTDPALAPGEHQVAALLDRLIGGVERHPWVVASVGAGLLGLTSLGIFRLQVATDFNENFRKSSPIVESYEFLADRMGVVGSLDVMIDMPDLASPDFDKALDTLQALQSELETQPHVLDTLSVVQLLDFVTGTNKPKPGSVIGGFLKVVPRRVQVNLISHIEERVVASFWNRDQNVARVQVQVGEVKGADAKRELVENIDAISKKHFPSARTAGVYILLTYVVQSLLADQWVTFGISVAVIYLMMAYAFRSPILGVVALLPNIAPILMVVGTMGWVGLKVNTATAMLASVSMGLAVDFSIHYLYRFQHERRAGKEFYQALRDAHGSVGLAMVLANLALVAGFSVLVVSMFIPTVHFGILVAVAMLGGLLSNLIVLPLLLRILNALKRL
jgi:predicted RND superfamily exporter protein